MKIQRDRKKDLLGAVFESTSPLCPNGTNKKFKNTSSIPTNADESILFSNLMMIIRNSRKSVRWSAVPVPCRSRLCLKLKGKQGSGPEGVDDLCFHTYGGFSPSSPPPPPSPFALPPGSRLKSQSRDPNPS